MDNWKRGLLFKKQSLERAAARAREVIAVAPEGSLRVDSSKTKFRFFHVTDNAHGLYIPDKNVAIAERLANKEYAETVLARAQKELDRIERFLRNSERDNAESVYANLSEARKKLVTPLLLDDETYSRRWLAQRYERSTSHPENLRFTTRKGDMVRSKTEAFIANTYFELGIPYRYDATLYLANNVVLHPDFTILDVARRQIVYHEHLGLLDKSEYLADAMWKLNEYRKNGIFVGKNLILTSEMDGYPFDPEQFRIRARETFLK